MSDPKAYGFLPGKVRSEPSKWQRRWEIGIGWSHIEEKKEAMLLAWKLGRRSDTKDTGQAGECGGTGQ